MPSCSRSALRLAFVLLTRTEDAAKQILSRDPARHGRRRLFWWLLHWRASVRIIFLKWFMLPKASPGPARSCRSRLRRDSRRFNRIILWRDPTRAGGLPFCSILMTVIRAIHATSVTPRCRGSPPRSLRSRSSPSWPIGSKPSAKDPWRTTRCWARSPCPPTTPAGKLGCSRKPVVVPCAHHPGIAGGRPDSSSVEQWTRAEGSLHRDRRSARPRPDHVDAQSLGRQEVACARAWWNWKK